MLAAKLARVQSNHLYSVSARVLLFGLCTRCCGLHSLPKPAASCAREEKAAGCAAVIEMAEPAKRVLVYGGKGALGAAVVASLKAQKFWVGSVDLAPNEEADLNVILKDIHSMQGQGLELQQALDAQLGSSQLDAVLCVAGGWAGGNAAQKDFVKSCELMWQQSVWSSVLAAQVAAKHLREGGLLTLTGANAALQPTAGMIGYGMAKAAVHHLVKSLASANGGLPANASVFGILPVTLDTPMNRKWMPDADHSTWTPLEYVAGLFLEWINGNERPISGSLVQLITAEGKTNLTLA